jgi:hypothetical protein
MPGANLNIDVYCGRDFYLSVTNQTSLGNPFNMTGYAAVMTVKANINDPDSKALYQGPPYASNLPFGQLSFKLSHQLTGSWWKAPPSGSGAISTATCYDVSYADTATPQKNWNTMLYGNVTLHQPVTVIIPGG